MSFFCRLYIWAGASLLSVLSMHLVASCSHGDFIVVLIALAFTAGGKRSCFARAKASRIARFRKHHMLKSITLAEPAHIFSRSYLALKVTFLCRMVSCSIGLVLTAISVSHTHSIFFLQTLGELSTCDTIDTFNLHILVCYDCYLSYFCFNLSDTRSPCVVPACSKTVCMAGMHFVHKNLWKNLGVNLGLMSATEVNYINLVEKGSGSGDVVWGWWSIYLRSYPRCKRYLMESVSTQINSWDVSYFHPYLNPQI